MNEQRTGSTDLHAPAASSDPCITGLRAVSIRAIAILLLLAAPLTAIAQQNVLIFGFNATTRHLIRFFSDAPSTIVSDIPIALSIGDGVAGMDFRPNTGQLYAVIGNGASPTSNPGKMIVIDPSTGATTQVGTTGVFNVDAGSNGIAFTPTVADRIRVVSAADSNYRLNPDLGTLAGADSPLAYAAGDPNVGTNPAISMIGYANHYFGAPTTTLYGIDIQTNSLVTIGGIGGTPSPNLGQVFTVGPLGIDVADGRGGLTIQPGTNQAYAAFQAPGGLWSLYRIDLATAKTTLLGTIGTGSNAIDAIAIAPASPCLDIDGDGRADALTDGLMLLRAMFGLDATAMSASALAPGSPRNTPAQVRSHLNSNCGMRVQ